MIVYRKNKKDDSWQVFGPCAEMRVGEVQVTTKGGGAKKEHVLSLSRSFRNDDGVECCYGILNRSHDQPGTQGTAQGAGEQPAAQATGKPAIRTLQDVLACLAELKAAAEQLLAELTPSGAQARAVESQPPLPPAQKGRPEYLTCSEDEGSPF